MKFQDYYETLGIARDATQDDIKRAYRKLARKYHPDVSKEADAEARFKAIGEAYAVLKEPDKRAAYDQMGRQYQAGQDFQPPPDWDAGFEFTAREFDAGDGAGHSDFFEALFGRRGRRAQTGRAAGPGMHMRGQDHHAKVLVDLADAYSGAQRRISLRTPVVDAQGHVTLQERWLDVGIPRGVQAGQHLRLAGQGMAGVGQGSAGDLYLEIAFNPDPRFRVEGRDVTTELALAPWEAALGATLNVPTPEGSVELTVPPNSASGRRLRLRGKGIPGRTPGDLFVVLAIVQPVVSTEAEREAYRALAKAFDFNPRAQSRG